MVPGQLNARPRLRCKYGKAKGGAWSRTNEAVDEVAVEMNAVFRRQQGEISRCKVRDAKGRSVGF